MKKSQWNFNHLKPNEFNCKCKNCLGKDSGLNMDLDFMESLAMARASSNVRFRIKRGSGFRCKAHNKKIGGASGSEHTKGLAVDIPYYNKRECYRIIYGLILSGFKRIQVYEYKNKKGRGWVHVDKSKSKSKPKEWFSIKKV
jgi:hypothetical protein